MIIVIANAKGGVGKTTTAADLAAAFALRGFPSLIIDVDPQGQIANALGLRQSNRANRLFQAIVAQEDQPELGAIEPSGRNNLDVITGGPATTLAATTVATALAARLTTLDSLVAELRNLVTRTGRICVIDTPPTTSPLQELAIAAADMIVVPTTLDAFAVAGTNQMLRLCAAINPAAALTILLTMFDHTRISRGYWQQITQLFGDRTICSVPIPRREARRQAAELGLTAHEFQPAHEVASCYSALINAILEGDFDVVR